MTTIHKIELESFFLISIVAAVSLYFVIQRNNQGQFNKSDIRIASIYSPIATPAPEQNIFSQISPDGTRKVIMKIISDKDNTQTYSFYTTDKNGINEQFVFTKRVDATKNMIIPFNTFSPDNKYFFIQENAVGAKSIFALKTSGETFSETEKYFDVTSLFELKNTGNNFSEATGWASESLIIVNTKKADGSKGPSYWFEVPSKAIIQLSTEF